MKYYYGKVVEADDGELMIEFPDDLMEKLAWEEGTRINWTDNGDGTWTVTAGPEEDKKNEE